MNQRQAIDVALALKKRYFDVPPEREEGSQILEGTAPGHLSWMVDTMLADEGIMSEGKTMRWLGYIQGVLVHAQQATLNEMKEASRKAVHG